MKSAGELIESKLSIVRKDLRESGVRPEALARGAGQLLPVCPAID